MKKYLLNKKLMDEAQNYMLKKESETDQRALELMMVIFNIITNWEKTIYNPDYIDQYIRSCYKEVEDFEKMINLYNEDVIIHPLCSYKKRIEKRLIADAGGICVYILIYHKKINKIYEIFK